MPGIADQSAVPVCGTADLAVTLEWEPDGPGLRGRVVAENVGGRTCRLPGKPTVTPLGLDGQQLPAKTVVTLEMMEPGYAVLSPGDRAAALARWPNWCGPQASDRALVSWEGGSATAQVHGPTQPTCDPGRPGDLTSSWFRVIE
jgi:Protein of unknown function (DUF4232)